MRGKLLWSSTILIALPVFLACTGSSTSTDGAPSLAESVEPPAECVTAWESKTASAFVELLVQATVPVSPVWVDYEAANSAFVLDAGTTVAGGSCLGLWKGGRAVSFGILADPPKLLTIMYGYHLSSKENGGPMDELVGAAAQPESIREWLEKAGVETAVLMPVDIEGLPFKLSTLHKVQIALHEAFHVDVQVSRWLDSEGDWPVWDIQPDRAGIKQCYVDSPEVESALAGERQALDILINSLLDGESAAACKAGSTFLEHRSKRYSALANVAVARPDGSSASCSEAEAIMEIEEGTADYVSWARLYDLELASRDQLIGRYRAQQADVFYLTGAMQLHAVSLILAGDMAETTRSIANSRSHTIGSLTTILSNSLNSLCGETDVARGAVSGAK